MTKQHEIKLEPGTWVAQDADGWWYTYGYEPWSHESVDFWMDKKGAGVSMDTLLHQPPNPNWRETKHQIQPGEVIYFEEE